MTIKNKGDFYTMSDSPTLILAVDRDDDIGFKGGIVSPVLGREACLTAANTLALVDPEDSDVNAIFQAVKMFDELKIRGEFIEIAILSGNHHDMLEGDRKIAIDLDRLIKSIKPSSCILVTDGVEDEYVLPIIQSRIPVSNLKRVVVTQIPNLESTYYIIKKLFEDPKIARVTLVPFGLAMILYAFAYLLGYPEGATIVVFGVVGIYLLLRGFGIDEIFKYFFTSLQVALRRGRLSFVTYISALIITVIGIIIGFTKILEFYPTEETFGLFIILITFIYGAIGWLTTSGFIIAIGKIIDTWISDSENFGEVIILPFFVIAIGLITYGATIYTLSITYSSNFPYNSTTGLQFLIFSTIGGLLCALFGLYSRNAVRHWRRQ